MAWNYAGYWRISLLCSGMTFLTLLIVQDASRFLLAIMFGRKVGAFNKLIGIRASSVPCAGEGTERRPCAVGLWPCWGR